MKPAHQAFAETLRRAEGMDTSRHSGTTAVRSSLTRAHRVCQKAPPQRFLGCFPCLRVRCACQCTQAALGAQTHATQSNQANSRASAACKRAEASLKSEASCNRGSCPRNRD